MKHGSNEPAHWKGIMRGADGSPDPYAIGRKRHPLAMLFQGRPSRAEKLPQPALFDHVKF
jgi:hypothetical protein